MSTCSYGSSSPLCLYKLCWYHQLSNTTIWWLDICCLLHRYQLHVSVRMAIFRLNELIKNISSYIWHASYIYGGGVFIGWGYEISCVLGREWGGGVYGFCCASLSIV